MPHLIKAVIVVAVSLISTWGVVASAAQVETEAKQAIVVDYDTGNVLFAKNVDERVGPASMAKMMTIHLLFERIKDGRMSLEEKLRVSERTWRQWYKSEGSKMFLEVGKEVKVEDLIRGIIVQSGNDASDVVAEAISGTVESFAEEMNRKARQLGMNDTNFRNPSGWPDPEQYTTVRDLATLSAATIREFPNLYGYYKEKTFTFNKIKQGNRNPLLFRDDSVDGLKTGHTNDSGYGLAASAEREGRRVIVVAHGMNSIRSRGDQVGRLLNWAFREWGQYALFDSGETVADLPVWLGAKQSVPVVTGDSLMVTVPRRSRKQMEVKVVHREAIPAPISRGDEVARLLVRAPGMEDITVPLYAGADVPETGFFGHIGAAITYMVKGITG